MGPTHAHRKPPTATHWLLTRISSALCRRKWQLFGFDCHGWRNLGVPLHTWDQTTITLVAAFLFAQAAKIQNNTVCRQSHGNCVLGSKGGIGGRLHGSWDHNKRWQVLWDTQKTQTGDSELEKRNADQGCMPSPRQRSTPRRPSNRCSPGCLDGTSSPTHPIVWA